jgi:integrase
MGTKRRGKPLTETAIKTDTKPRDKVYRVADEKGLCLEVRPNGSKLWRYRYRLDGKASMFSLGAYPKVSLADARKKRDDAKELVQQGIHPVQDKKTKAVATKVARANTFKAVTEAWLAENKPNWAASYYDRTKAYFENRIFDSLGDLPIKSVTAPQLRDVMLEVAKTAPTRAIALCNWCSAVFRYAVMHDLAENDPAAALKGLIKRPPVRHNPAIKKKEIPGLLARLDKFAGFETTKIAVRLLLLTFVRTGELRGARWEEVDFDARLWTIPQERMKKRREHVVPLSNQAIDQLLELQKWSGNREFLFPNQRNPKTHMGPTTINRALEVMGYGGKLSAHGFRSTASTILNEMGYRPDVIEKQLAHTESNQVRASYNHALYFEERRQMMQDWADLIDQLVSGGNVVAGNFGMQSA